MGIVYTCFTTDVIHAGHLNIIHEAQKYGDVVVGVMTDKALVQFDRFPTISFYERKKMVQEITGVSEVVEQDSIMYDTVISKITTTDNVTCTSSRYRNDRLSVLVGKEGTLVAVGNEL